MTRISTSPPSGTARGGVRSCRPACGCGPQRQAACPTGAGAARCEPAGRSPCARSLSPRAGERGLVGRRRDVVGDGRLATARGRPGGLLVRAFIDQDRAACAGRRLRRAVEDTLAARRRPGARERPPRRRARVGSSARRAARRRPRRADRTGRPPAWRSVREARSSAASQTTPRRASTSRTAELASRAGASQAAGRPGSALRCTPPLPPAAGRAAARARRRSRARARAARTARAPRARGSRAEPRPSRRADARRSGRSPSAWPARLRARAAHRRARRPRAARRRSARSRGLGSHVCG